MDLHRREEQSPVDLARLLPLADQNEILVSNVLQHAIARAGPPCELEALPPFDARSLGMLHSWRLASAAPELRGAAVVPGGPVTTRRPAPGGNERRV